MARIQAAYDNLKPALATWKLESYGRDCLLVFSESEEWMVGCPEMAGSAGFLPTLEKYQGSDVLWNPKSFFVGGRHQPYEQVKLSLVGTVGKYTNETDKTDRPVLMIQEWDALHKNHPGFQKSNIEEWLGVFVHEAFHAHQMWQPRVRQMIQRWAQEKPATPEDLASFYKQNAGFKAAIGKEFELLRAASDDEKSDAKKAAKALADWLVLYRARQKTFGSALESTLPGKQAWMMDGFEMFLEGSARYVEVGFLTNPGEESLQTLSAEPTFQNFASSKGKRASQVEGLGNIGSKYFYALGMYLCLLLDRADPTWKEHLFESDGLLLARVERVATGGK